jgi:F-type H+-transporting ATPase subunit a
MVWFILIVMENLGFDIAFTIPVLPFMASLFPNGIAVTETVIVSWAVMFVLIVFALIITRNLKTVPKGIQSVMESAVDFLNGFSKNQFGKWAPLLAPYMGTLFLFLLLSNVIGCLTPMSFEFMGHHYKPLFEIKPPTRDINVTAPLAVITILLTLILGFASKGPLGWLKTLTHPVAFMVPFNLMEYGTRLLSLCLRLFGNILGGMILMTLVSSGIPIVVPAVLSLYFDFFDGILQSVIFVFLSTLYIAEACKPLEHS